MSTYRLLTCHVLIGRFQMVRLSSAFIVGSNTQQVKHLWKEGMNALFDSATNDPPLVVHHESNRNYYGQQVVCSLSKGIPQGFLSI